MAVFIERDSRRRAFTPHAGYAALRSPVA